MICDSSKKCFDNICPNLKRSPYVCNGCVKKHNCRLIKYYYNARNANNDYIDLRRKIRYKPRKNGIKVTGKETKIRINRTYKDFLDYILQHPNYNIVEMDTVEGVKGGKVFLTLYFRKSHLMLIFILDNKTTDEVNRVFDELKETLGSILFNKLFRIILTDNGSEFYDPDSIENYNNIKIINLFYCDPRHSEQKDAILLFNNIKRRKSLICKTFFFKN